MDFSSPQFPFNFTIRATFVVKNIITNSNKTIRIFNYPIPVGTTRDLLKIPGVSEANIRASLLKGELRNKILAGEIQVMNSDVDLLQFNIHQKTLLQNAGVVDGLDVTNSITNALTAQGHQTLRQLIHFVDNGPGDGFASGAVRVTAPDGSPFPTSVTWYLDSSLTTKLVEKLITYNSNQVPITIVWNMYDTDGVSIIHTVTDTFTYTNNVFESNRNRTIS